MDKPKNLQSLTALIKSYCIEPDDNNNSIMCNPNEFELLIFPQTGV